MDYMYHENYEKLAQAIILQAVRDYRNGCYQTRCSIERFFRSDWFMVLTNLNGEMIIKRLEAAKKELENAHKFKYIIENDIVERAVDELIEVYSKETE